MPLYQKWKKASVPGRDKLRLISGNFGCSPEWLLGIETIGDRMLRTREAMRLPLAEFQLKFSEIRPDLNLDVFYWARLEQGKIEVPGNIIKPMAQILGLKYEQLIGDEPILKKNRGFG